MRTLDRYVIREILPPFFLSLVIFTFILEIPPVMRDLERLVAKGVPWGTAALILLTLVPQGLGLTIPMATLTGILIGLGRLSGDREAVALLACGVSPYRLLRPVLAFALVTTAATTYVMLQAIPDANQTFREITFDLVSKKVATDIRPRVFFEEFPGFVLYMQDQEADGGDWKGVLVADSSKPEAPTVFMADRGRVVIDRDRQLVELVLASGVQYSVGKPGESGIYSFPNEVRVPLDPKTVFQRPELPRTVTEKSIAELRADAERKLLKEGYSPHPEIMYTQQKFSIPAACLVFAIIGLALGLTSARDTKMAGFVVGLVVVFVYYAILEIGAAQTRGHYREIEDAARQTKNPSLLINANWAFAYLARWWPNIVMGIFGLAALIWRARFAQRGMPVSVPLKLPQLPSGWQHARNTPPVAAPTGTPGSRQRVVIVVRIPRLRIPGGMGVLDRYVSRLYIRVFGLSFVGLLSLFYISMFVDKAEKVFKGDATTGQVLTLMSYSTPEFIYFIIPLAVLIGTLVTFGMLSRTSELTVTKACGISLYRTALPLLALSLVASAVLFGARAAGPGAEQTTRGGHRPRDPQAADQDVQPDQPQVDRRTGRQHLPLRVLRSAAAHPDLPLDLQAASECLASRVAHPRGDGVLPGGRVEWRQGLGTRLLPGAAGLPAVRPPTAAAREPRLLRIRDADRAVHDGGGTAETHGRLEGVRLRRHRSRGRTPTEDRLPLRHGGDDLARGALRRHDRPPRRPLRHRYRHRDRPRLLGPPPRLSRHRRRRPAAPIPRRLERQHHRRRLRGFPAFEYPHISCRV